MVSRSLAGQFGWAVVARIGASAIGLISIVVYSRYLGPSEYGRLALGQATAIMIYSVLYFWLIASITRLSVVKGDQLPIFRGAVLSGFALCSVVAALAALAGYVGWRVITGEDLVVFFAGLGLVSIGEAFAERNLEHFRAFSRSRAYAFMSLLRAVLTMTGGWSALLLVGPNAEVVLVGHAVGCLVAAIIGEIMTPEKITFAASPKKALAEMWQFGSPFSISFVFRIAIQRLDRFVIAAIFGTDATGVYTVAFDFARRSLGIVLMVVNIVIYPEMVRAWEGDDRSSVQRLAFLNWQLLLTLGIPSIVGLFLVAPEALTVFFGAVYAIKPAPLIVTLAAACTFLEALKLHHADLAFMLRSLTREQIFINGIGFMVNIIGCISLIPHFGPTAAAGTALTTFAVMLLLSKIRGQKHYEMPFDLQPMLGLLTACAAMVGAIWLLRDWHGMAGLAGQVVAGGIVFAAALFGFNLANSRDMMKNLFDANRWQQ